jgi:LPS sulfotransferase NodH
VFTPQRSYLLVGWPRTGSTVLADALTETGVLGRVHEYFWRLQEPRHAQALGLSTPTDETYESYLEATLRHATSPNGVFGAKLFWVHAIDLVRRTALMPTFADLPPLARLWAPFGDDVRLVFMRRNCLRSALSLWRAEVTEQWGRQASDVPAAPPNELDVWRVSQLHAELHAAEMGWQSVIAASDLPGRELTYEAVVTDLTSAVRTVADLVDVELPVDLAATTAYQRQADETTDSFEARWIDITGGCSRCAIDPTRLYEKHP